MDLRTVRTIKSIKEAFMKIRRTKPLEKITVKEIAELAFINKSTFYRYYEDIYALSNEIENDIISECVAEYPGLNELSGEDGIQKLTDAIIEHKDTFSVVFSGSRNDISINKLHDALMEKILLEHPELKNDIQKKVIITSVIYGNFKTFQIYQNEDRRKVIDGISKLSELLRKYVV